MKDKSRSMEQEINKVLVHHDMILKEIQEKRKQASQFDTSAAEKILKSRGCDLPQRKDSVAPLNKRRVVVVRPWNEILEEADKFVVGECEIESIFTDEELQQNKEAVRLMNEEFNQIHHLDKVDVAIGALAGIVGAAVDILMVGIPEKTPEGLKAGPLSNYIRDYFDKKFPEEEMQKLANSKESKVPFDAQDDRHTTICVEGLSAYYHRLLQLGHDPVLGFVFGVADILTGRMTTIDKTGKVVSQVMENYADRKETEIFRALAKQIAHFKSDVTTSMGLPAPFMSMFNLLQFGNIGEYDQTIAEIVQGMYFEGYDFIHFCSMSIPTMLVEVIVRMGYAFKRINEGHAINDSIPVSLNREKHPKLSTMLFLGHSAATAVNAGKVAFTENPMAINYAQWIAFTKYSYSQLKWAVIKKPTMRDAYVTGKIYEEMNVVFDEVDNTFEEYTRDKIVIYR
ncbi:MAG: hypothetical protein E7C03_01380 [Anaerococcus sp.]|nr:hypothetical protein HMPREF3224_01101 [Anaerococcus hydrogenalis]MDU2829115.1 hypothetical protein [Anaerococcus sp.]MDU6063727.1 hypothetical protein [Anaerococcus sp.]